MTRDPVSRLHGAQMEEREDGRATLKIGAEQRDLDKGEAADLKSALRTAAVETGSIQHVWRGDLPGPLRALSRSESG